MRFSTRIERLESLANRVIAPDFGPLEGTPFVLPEPTEQQVIDWIEYQSIALYLEAADGGWAHNERGWYPDKRTVDARLAWCHEALEWLQLAHKQGEIDADTYTRLTTKQIRTKERQSELKLSVESWRPTFDHDVRSRSDGRTVSRFTFRTGPGLNDWRFIFLVGDAWVTYPDTFRPWDEPGW